jgi:hypothetical protein
VIRRSLTRLAAVAVAAVALSACRVDSTISMKVNPNGSGTVTVVVSADKDIVSKTKNLEADLRTADLETAGWEVDKPVKGADGSLSVTLTHPFRTPSEATTVLSQINDTRGPLKNVVLARSGKDTNSTWKLRGKLEVNGGLEAFADDVTLPLLDGAPYKGELEASGLDLGKAVGVTFTVQLPGKIDATSGLQENGTITWRVPMDGSSTDIATTTTNVDVASSVSRVARVVLLALLVLWVVATLILLLLVLGARTRR